MPQVIANPGPNPEARVRDTAANTPGPGLAANRPSARHSARTDSMVIT